MIWLYEKSFPHAKGCETLWEQEYQLRHTKEGKAIPEKNEIGATEAAPMINAALNAPSSVIECTFIEEHSFQKNSKKTSSFSCVET